MRDLLGRFGLMGDQVFQKVADLSGGEKSRAALARLVVLGVNVLVIATSNGSTLFDYHTGVSIAGECTVSNGVIYVPAANGTLIALGQ